MQRSSTTKTWGRANKRSWSHSQHSEGSSFVIIRFRDYIDTLHSQDLVNTSTSIRNDLHITQDLKAKVDQAVEDTIVTTRIIDGFRNHQSGNTYLKDHAGFPLEYVFPLSGSAFTYVELCRYFSRVCDQMKQRLDWYKSTIEVSYDHGIYFPTEFWHSANWTETCFGSKFDADPTKYASSLTF